MISLLEIARTYVARGWHVFPLKPKDKYPLISKAAGGKGFYDATLDVEQITAWWTKYPQANIGIATGASDLYVVDNDHGLTSEEDFHAWRMRNNLPVTYTVRTGGRPDFRVQMYFRGATECNGKWELDGCSGEIRSMGGLCVAAGSIHPDSGETYQVLVDAPLAPRPAVIEQAVKQAEAVARVPRAPGQLITENRNMALTSEIGKFRDRNPGVSQSVTLASMLAWNDEEMACPLDGDEVQDTVAKQYRQYPDAKELPTVVIGSAKQPKPVTDWRDHYHTLKEFDEVKPPSFIIKGVLQLQAILMIAAFVGQKKTLLALNLVWSLLTGNPLFGKFAVIKKPSRVLYLGPENGLISFVDRLKRLGLREYVGKTLFFSTMSMSEPPGLLDLTREEIEGAVVIIDTLIRYSEGNENDSAAMKIVAESAFKLIRDGAGAVIVLHHSTKGSVTGGITLENCSRGSGELVAFTSAVIGMRTQDQEHDYESASLIKFVKKRDFDPDPASFEVLTDRETCLMSYVDGSDGAQAQLGNTANKDGQDDAAIVLMKVGTNPKLSNVKMAKLLEGAGIDRSKEWVRLKRLELGIGGLKTGAATASPL
jgi:hypothetical protein